MVTFSPDQGHARPQRPGQGYIPDAAFVQLCVSWLPSIGEDRGACALHNFVTRRSPSGSAHRNYICVNCHIHLRLDRRDANGIDDTAGLPQRCTGGEAPNYLHHLHMSRSLNPVMTDASCRESSVNFMCCQCGISLEAALSVPIISHSTLTGLLSAKFERNQSTALSLLFKYGDNISNGKPVNSKNPRFVEFLGEGASVKNIMGLLGFTFRADNLHYEPASHAEPGAAELATKRRLLALEEISVTIYDIRQKLSLEMDTDCAFEEAATRLCQRFGDMLRNTSWRVSATTVDSMSEHYSTLGILPDALESKVKFAFSMNLKHDPDGSQFYMESLERVVRHRNSSTLEEFFAIERTKGNDITLSELRSAYRMFDLSESDELGDDLLVSLFQAAVNNRPAEIDTLREALKIIGRHRNSIIIEAFLQIRQNISQLGSFTSDDSLSLPKGLNNIGNTCYFNSLLQFYLTVRPLREIVKTKGPSLLSSMGNAVESSTMPGGNIDKKAVRFVHLLGNLFSELVTSNVRAVTPPQELAEIALKSTTEEMLFGLQQDVDECMNFVLDLLETAFKRSSEPEVVNLIKRVFYGKTKQKLLLPDSSDVSEKEEEFSSLILEITPNLYQSLDNAFKTSPVEYQEKIAEKSLSVSALPPILIISLKRVQFSIEANQAFKNNEFLKFYDTIYMDRYLSLNAGVAEKRRAICAEWQLELDKLKAQLLSVSNGVIENALTGLMSLPSEVTEEQASDPRRDVAINYLARLSEDRDAEREGIDGKIAAVELQLEAAYNDMTSHPYSLHAVFGHQGEAQFGHYWIYIKDHQRQEWHKFNDSVVSTVENLSEIFGDSTGSDANAYCLVYVAEGERQNIVGL